MDNTSDVVDGSVVAVDSTDEASDEEVASVAADDSKRPTQAPLEASGIQT